MDLNIKIGNSILPNPVCVASGTFGYGSEYESLVNLTNLGAIFTKAVTLKPRDGNDIPRIIETPSGLLNSIGLANVGVDRFITEKMPFLQTLPCAIIPNIAGSTEDEYCEIIDKLEQTDGIWGYEVNISCPNVKKGALAFGTDPDNVSSLTNKVRKLTKKPLIIKVTPNVTDIALIAKAAENSGADAISCINTLVGMVIDTKLKRTILPAGTGGLSGPAIRPVGVALTYKVARAVSIPVIGIGGIMNADDAIQYLLAGASAIQVGTANFVDPACTENIIEGITNYTCKEGCLCVEDLHQLLLS